MVSAAPLRLNTSPPPPLPLRLARSQAMQLRVAALLEGPRGSGCSTAARAAAAALGLNFIPWSCAELKVG